MSTKLFLLLLLSLCVSTVHATEEKAEATQHEKRKNLQRLDSFGEIPTNGTKLKTQVTIEIPKNICTSPHIAKKCCNHTFFYSILPMATGFTGCMAGCAGTTAGCLILWLLLLKFGLLA